jgi:hypothetical protein
MAETWRKVGRLAVELDLPRAGYDTIRLIVREHRHRRQEDTNSLSP